MQANGVFLKLSDAVQQALRFKGWVFYTFIGGAARFMFSWDTAPERVEALITDLRAVTLPGSSEAALCRLAADTVGLQTATGLKNTSHFQELASA